jgi:DNA-binding response OmpR family regulator
VSINQLIAVLDDEPDILELVSLNLKNAGFRTSGFLEAESFYRFLDGQVPDLIILDLMLPGMDGFEICRHLRNGDRFSSIPIIMLTAKAAELDKILGLELGADDYVTKPFSPRELVARVKAVLRRHEPREDTGKMAAGGILVLDPQTCEVEVEGKRVELTATEFKILELLLSRRSRVFSRDQILDHLWGNEKTVVDRTIDVHIRHLREKLGEAARFVKNIRGMGYKLDE